MLNERNRPYSNLLDVSLFTSYKLETVFLLLQTQNEWTMVASSHSSPKMFEETTEQVRSHTRVTGNEPLRCGQRLDLALLC